MVDLRRWRGVWGAGVCGEMVFVVKGCGEVRMGEEMLGGMRSACAAWGEGGRRGKWRGLDWEGRWVGLGWCRERGGV